MAKSGHDGRTWWLCFILICQFIVLKPGSQWYPHCTHEEIGAQRKLGESTHREHPLGWESRLHGWLQSPAHCPMMPAYCNSDLKVVGHGDLSLQELPGFSQWQAGVTTLLRLLPTFLGASYQYSSWASWTVCSFLQQVIVMCVEFFTEPKKSPGQGSEPPN